MRGIGHIHAALVVGALSLSFLAWGCGTSKNGGSTDTDDTGATVVDEEGGTSGSEDGGTVLEDGVYLSTDTLTVDHTVGTTECPTSVGSFAIENDTDLPITAEITIDDGVALTLTAMAEEDAFIRVKTVTVVVPARGKIDVAVEFDCTTQETFTKPVHVKAGEVTGDVNVTVNITKGGM